MINSEELQRQAEYFAYAYLDGKPARMPRILFSQWPVFIATVKKRQGEYLGSLNKTGVLV